MRHRSRSVTRSEPMAAPRRRRDREILSEPITPSCPVPPQTAGPAPRGPATPRPGSGRRVRARASTGHTCLFGAGCVPTARHPEWVLSFTGLTITMSPRSHCGHPSLCFPVPRLVTRLSTSNLTSYEKFQTWALLKLPKITLLLLFFLDLLLEIT